MKFEVGARYENDEIEFLSEVTVDSSFVTEGHYSEINRIIMLERIPAFTFRKSFLKSVGE